MDYNEYEDIVINAAKNYLKYEYKIYTVCADRIAFCFSSGKSVNDAVNEIVGDTLFWEVRNNE